MLTRDEAIEMFHSIIRGDGLERSKEKYKTLFRMGDIAHQLWNSGCFTLGAEYGYLMALTDVFDLVPKEVWGEYDDVPPPPQKPKFANLQTIKRDTERDGFKTAWGNHETLIIYEQRRILHWSSGRWTIYGISYDEMKSLDTFDDWDISLVLQGPPFWTTSDLAAVVEAAQKFNLTVKEG